MSKLEKQALPVDTKSATIPSQYEPSFESAKELRAFLSESQLLPRSGVRPPRQLEFEFQIPNSSKKSGGKRRQSRRRRAEIEAPRCPL
ncbi:MAG: hypothetical protein ABSG78_06850 [Verrucomicrobiota bacterium]|jgi:hypothetical protein